MPHYICKSNGIIRIVGDSTQRRNEKKNRVYQKSASFSPKKLGFVDPSNFVRKSQKFYEIFTFNVT